MPHQTIWRWYTGRWWVGGHIWYSKEVTGRGPSPSRPLLAVPNVTATHQQSVYQSPYCCIMFCCSAVWCAGWRVNLLDMVMVNWRHLCNCEGDYGSAIETLVTAVSLIKQSKIANDDRCRILISSLQDTLHGIELKSYGSKWACFLKAVCNR